MKKNAFILLAVVLITALSSVCTHLWMAHRTAVTEPIAHEWLHDELHLSKEQLAALGPIETKFADGEKLLTAKLREANRELADVISAEKNYTPRVAAAVETVHHHMGELQKASLEHVFEMRQVLTPEQGDKLLKLVAQTLEQNL